MLLVKYVVFWRTDLDIHIYIIIRDVERLIFLIALIARLIFLIAR